MKLSRSLGVSRQPASLRPVDMVATTWMLLLTFLWGVNAVTITMVTQAIPPLLSAGLRGLVALVALSGYGRLRGERLSYRGMELVHGGTAGVIFGLEFMLIYTGARFTNGGHLSLFLNTAPIFVACGAHFILPGERLHLYKSLGLLLAFTGVGLLFSEEFYMEQRGYWRGDAVVLAGALLWAMNTLYVKRFMVQSFTGFRLLHCQVLVSTPLLLGVSWLSEPAPQVELGAMLLLAFQGLVVVFFSYLMWMRLLTRYPASGVQSFTFFSPLWGVLTGILVLDESVSAPMVTGMVCIGMGLYLVNRPQKK